MTQKYAHEGKSEILLKGYGMGILYHDFVGELEEAKFLESELKLRLDEGSVSFLTFKLHKAQAIRLRHYLDRFKELGCDRHYGLSLRPLQSEGGGCSAFAASCLTASGVMRPEFEQNWTQTVRIPEALIGGPGKPYVSFLKTLLTTRWAEENEPHSSLFFWDPDKMHQWLEKTYSNLLNSRERSPYLPLRHKKAQGLFIDCSALDCPEGSPFIVQTKSSRPPS
jgi:hypothetical protein